MALPPLLSPTLPPQYALPLEPISPTLPQMFKRSLVVKLKYKPMPKIKKRPKVSSTRDFSSSEDESTPIMVKKVEPKVEHKLESEDTKPSTPSNPQSNAPKSSSSSTPKKLPPQFREYRDALQYWLQQAKQKKHKSDSAISNRQHRLAAVVSMDSIICFIRAFDYEDRADRIAGRVPHTRSWETLVPYLSQMVTYLESVDSDIAGVCYAIRAVLQVYIGQTILKTRAKTSQDPASVLNRALTDFGKGLIYLPLDTITQKYNLQWRDNERNADRLDPEKDQCVLPLHVNSTMQDAAAFAFSVTKEWARHERIDYIMGCSE